MCTHELTSGWTIFSGTFVMAKSFFPTTHSSRLVSPLYGNICGVIRQQSLLLPEEIVWCKGLELFYRLDIIALYFPKVLEQFCGFFFSFLGLRLGEKYEMNFISSFVNIYIEMWWISQHMATWYLWWQTIQVLDFRSLEKNKNRSILKFSCLQ